MKSRNQLYIFVGVWLVVFLLCSILSAVAYSTDNAAPDPSVPAATDQGGNQNAEAGDKAPATTTDPSTGGDEEVDVKPGSPYDSLTYSAANAQYLIYVDAGHGWYDNGSSVRLTADGEYVFEETDENGNKSYVTESGKAVTAEDFEYVYEKNINFELSKKLKNALEKMGYTVGETRPGDNDADCPVELIGGIFKAQRRTAYVNSKGANYLVSLHCNTFGNTEVNGTRLFYYQTKDLSKKLAQNLQQSLLSEMGMEAPLYTDNLAITRESAMPSVLIETAFITNHDDLNNLLDPDWQDRFVCAIAKGIDADLHQGDAQ
ncbi:MAG: N-acetylmuramoyl-L-alanine amidase [Clostridia bacterium]|nr:N-acetylmuramoyl-L-alanine amidase [Clostridia bacterium]